MNARNLSLALVLISSVAGCGLFGPGKPPVPPFQASFSYSAPKQAAKLDVTVAVVAPQFTGDGTSWWAGAKGFDTSKRLVSSLKSSFAELMNAKGFNTTGPFDALDTLTFPEKKGSELALFPSLDFSITLEVLQRDATPVGGGQVSMRCSVNVKASGNISLIVLEPMTGEKLWTKRIEVTVPPEQAIAAGNACMGSATDEGQLPDAWKKAHVAVYTQTMQALDKYVNGEEFQGLKKSAEELRAKKVY